MKKDGVLFAAFLLISFVIMSLIMYFGFNSFYQKYPKINLEQSYNSQIHTVYVLYGGTYITLQDGRKISIPNSVNRNYDNEYLTDIVEKGDYIIKAANTDSLTIMKESGEKYLFVIDRVITEGNTVEW